jgi:hypothetical protein
MELLKSGRDEPVARSLCHKATSVMKSLIDQSGTHEASPGMIDSPVSDESSMRLLSRPIEAAVASR